MKKKRCLIAIVLLLLSFNLLFTACEYGWSPLILMLEEATETDDVGAQEKVTGETMEDAVADATEMATHTATQKATDIPTTTEQPAPKVTEAPNSTPTPNSTATPRATAREYMLKGNSNKQIYANPRLISNDEFNAMDSQLKALLGGRWWLSSGDIYDDGTVIPRESIVRAESHSSYGADCSCGANMRFTITIYCVGDKS